MTCHALDRCYERYGIWLTVHGLRLIEAAILADDPRAIRLGFTDLGGELIAWRSDRRWLALAFDRGLIRTFLPSFTLDPHAHRLRNRGRHLRRMKLAVRRERKPA